MARTSASMGHVTKIERAAIAWASLPVAGADCQAYEARRRASPRAPSSIPGLTAPTDSGAMGRKTMARHRAAAPRRPQATP
jgi:hypothetical protein